MDSLLDAQFMQKGKWQKNTETSKPGLQPHSKCYSLLVLLIHWWYAIQVADQIKNKGYVYTMQLTLKSR